MTHFVYVLTNSAMPGLLKIGKTDVGVDQRMKDFYYGHSGVPEPFECAKAVEVESERDARALEAALHGTHEPNRPNPKREFFTLRLQQVSVVMDAWPGAKDITESIQNNVYQSPEDEEAREALSRSASRIRSGTLYIGEEPHYCRSSAAALRRLVTFAITNYSVTIEQLLSCSAVFQPIKPAPTNPKYPNEYSLVLEGLWVRNTLSRATIDMLMPKIGDLMGLKWGEQLRFEEDAI